MKESEKQDEKFMAIALREAEKAKIADEVPIGAVIIAHGKVIAKAGNCTERTLDVTAHAEILAITSATEYLGTKFLTDCELYVTLEPCAMCAGAIKWARLKRVVYAAQDLKAGYTLYHKSIIPPKVEIVSGVSDKESLALLKDFFKAKRK